MTLGSHPLNLALRFLLEMTALAATAYWGWILHDGAGRWLWAIGLPWLLAIVWGTFAVPGDPSRSGAAPVPVPGALRLGLELAIFGLGAWALGAAGRPGWGIVLAVVVVAHYFVSADRIRWLLA